MHIDSKKPFIFNIVLYSEALKKMNKGANLTSNCSHTPDHKKERIEYICIEPDCRSIRQLCNLCVIERHRKHNVFHIDRICFPMGLLNQNSYLPNSDRIYADL